MDCPLRRVTGERAQARPAGYRGLGSTERARQVAARGSRSVVVGRSSRAISESSSPRVCLPLHSDCKGSVRSSLVEEERRSEWRVDDGPPKAEECGRVRRAERRRATPGPRWRSWP